MKTLMTLLLSVMLTASAHATGTLTYTVGDMSFEGYKAPAKGPSKGLVLVIHDWDGLTDYEVRRSDMLAAMGYDAFAVDLYGKGNRPVKTEDKKAEIGKLYNDRETMRTRILGGLAEARKTFTGKAVVMGYCFGGAATLELARSGKGEDIVGYTSFHGGLSTPKGQSYSADTAPILVAHGGADSLISLDDVATLAKELEAAQTPYEIQVYSGAPHAFTVFGSKAYRDVADTQSWAAFTDFLQTHLGQ